MAQDVFPMTQTLTIFEPIWPILQNLSKTLIIIIILHAHRHSLHQLFHKGILCKLSVIKCSKQLIIWTNIRWSTCRFISFYISNSDWVEWFLYRSKCFKYLKWRIIILQCTRKNLCSKGLSVVAISTTQARVKDN